MRRAIVGFVALLAGCPNQVRSDPPMTNGFDKARSAFRDHAADQFKVPSKNVDVIPKDQALADDFPLGTQKVPGKIGAAWPFEASAEGPKDLAGWALPDGTVITARHNLGRLFDEAGYFGATQRSTPVEMAERLVWASGGGGRLEVAFRGPPTFESKDGRGTLQFVRAYRPPGPGTKVFMFQGTVTLSPDKTAQLAWSQDLNK